LKHIFSRQTNGEEPVFYRAKFNSENLAKLSVDLFDYEAILELTRSSKDGEKFICESIKESTFEMLSFPENLFQFECPIVRIKLDGIPTDLKNVKKKNFDEEFEAFKKLLQDDNV
jgi:hypothetical protein